MVGLGCLITFTHVTAGAWRSLIQMLHLECIFTLPPPPAAWAQGRLSAMFEDQKRESELQVPQKESEHPHWRVRSSFTVQEDHDRLLQMDEYDLADAVTFFTRDLKKNHTKAMSENENDADWDGEQNDNL
jgi:hypothetical protein